MPTFYQTRISLRAITTLILALLMMACIVMNWHAGQAYGRTPDEQSNAGATAPGESRDTDSMEQVQSSSQRMGRDVERTEYSDRESEAAAVGSQRSVPAEFYGAIFGGYTIAHGIDIEGTGLGSFVNLGTIGLKDSGVYGGKAGFFFPGRGNWAGVEVEAFHTSPDIKGTTIGSTVGVLPIPMAGVRIPGAQLSVTTVALNAIARAKFLCQREPDADDFISVRQEQPPLCALQPYAGLGLGVFFADLSSPFGSIESPVLGLNVLGGVRYYFTRQIALFGEYKYNRASFRVDNIEGTGAGIDGVYSVSHIVGGLSLHW